MEIISSHRIHEYELYSSILKRGFVSSPHCPPSRFCLCVEPRRPPFVAWIRGRVFGEFPPARRHFHCRRQQHKVHYESGHNP